MNANKQFQPPVNDSREPFSFAELFPLREKIAEMPPLEPYQTRNGSVLSFRRYSAESNTHSGHILRQLRG